MKSEYIATIGIECHVQLKTKTKLFASVDNDAREADPNTLVSPICFGMPGALPVLNEKAIYLATRAAFALGVEPQKFSKFDRKHYFYPDLPLGYQITQFEEPIILGGNVKIVIDGLPKNIGITRAHLEADAGKSTHPGAKDYSLVDLNRAGTPLLEIVSEPDMHTAAEARAYAHELWLLMRYADVSFANLYYGNMRFDVNVSVSKDPNILGTRTETKNLNSFKSVEKSVEYEIKRQSELIDGGGVIAQETRGWDDAKQKTYSMRTKEDAHDYRYFPDADIPPVLISQEYIDDIKNQMTAMPDVYREKLRKIGQDEAQVETIIDEPEIAELMGKIIEHNDEKTSKTIANWFTGELLRFVIDEQITWQDTLDKSIRFVKLAEMVTGNKLSSTAAKSLLLDIVQKGSDPEQLATEKNLLQVSDTAELESIVISVLDSNIDAAADVKNGEMKAIGFLVGQVMKASAGKANPGVVQQIIRKILGV